MVPLIANQHPRELVTYEAAFRAEPVAQERADRRVVRGAFHQLTISAASLCFQAGATQCRGAVGEHGGVGEGVLPGLANLVEERLLLAGGFEQGEESLAPPDTRARGCGL